jgi:hypothetical protein
MLPLQVTFVASAQLAASSTCPGLKMYVNEQGRLTQLPASSNYNPADGNSQVDCGEAGSCATPAGQLSPGAQAAAN